MPAATVVSKWLLFSTPAIYPFLLDRGLEMKMLLKRAVNNTTVTWVGGEGHGQA